MTFGWEGFSFNHPDDWAPVVMSGHRREGYARIASPGRLILQCRWRKLRNAVDAERFLNSYLGRLERDSRHAGKTFTSERELEGGRVYYRYSGATTGRGAFFQCDEDGRAFVLELVSSRSDSMTRLLRDVLNSFRLAEETERWSAFGLDLALPKGLEVERREFLAGKTRLAWRGKGVSLDAERWGFADQLLARHGLEAWARAVLDAERGTVAEEGSGLRFHVPGRLGAHAEAIVGHQPDRNQIVFVRSTSRQPFWRPQWDWLT